MKKKRNKAKSLSLDASDLSGTATSSLEQGGGSFDDGDDENDYAPRVGGPTTL